MGNRLRADDIHHDITKDREGPVPDLPGINPAEARTEA